MKRVLPLFDAATADVAAASAASSVTASVAASPPSSVDVRVDEERATHWRAARNLLCVRLDYMGDVLMCTPAMRALRESAGPQANRRITLLTAPGSVALARHTAEIDDVIGWEAPWMKASAPRHAASDLSMVARLAEYRFDAAVIFTTYSQNPLPAAWLCHLAGIPLRLAHCHENPYQLLTDWVRDPEPEQAVRHEVQRQLDLVAHIGCATEDVHLSFQVTEADARWARDWLRDMDISSGRPWVLMHPGATAASRRYPASHWATVTSLLAERLRCPIVFTGSKDEAGLVESIRRAATARTYSLAGQLTLGELGALIQAAPVMVANNTGPAHLAAALGTPLVDLYALTNPQHTPWQVQSRVLFHPVPCRNCYRSVCPEGHHACLQGVSPRQVEQAVLELLATPRERPRGPAPTADAIA